MTAPVIGLTTYNGENKQGQPIVALMRKYIDIIIEAGGVPVLIPSGLTDKAYQSLIVWLDGILLTGGGDISPDRYGGDPYSNDVKNKDSERDEIEIGLVKSARVDGKPFLGICRGFQVVNVALGGTLYTHIEAQMPNAKKHDYYPKWPRNHPAHTVKVEQDSRLAEILGETSLSVNSLHHQGAKEVPAALKAVAWAPDGLVEGLELPSHPFGIAVQWHPEWLTDQPSARRLFRAFVEAAENHGKK